MFTGQKKMKIKIVEKKRGEIDKVLISERVDTNYLNSVGVALGKRLGKGAFGIVFEVAADLGDGLKEYALKYVDHTSPGFVRERKNYQGIKKFVDLANATQDTEAIKLSQVLPIIHSVSEHQGNLFILMEKLIPLSSSEEKLFMNHIHGMAMHYSERGNVGHGEGLLNKIIDKDGEVGLIFDVDRARAMVKMLSKAQEFRILKKNPQKYVDMIMAGGSDINSEAIIDALDGGKMTNDIEHEAIRSLFEKNQKFKKFFNGISRVIISTYKDQNSTDVFNDIPFMGMVLSQIFKIVFAQRYPMKYSDDFDQASAFQTGYGQSSEIYDTDTIPNPKLSEDYDISGLEPNPAQQATDKPSPQKYPFDSLISAVRKLGRDWMVVAKDMHNANVMKRANGQYVIADIGLFNVKQVQSFQSGIFESKRKIKVKVI